MAEAQRGDPSHADDFATKAAEYAHLRPTYPDDPFEFLATVVASRNIAWDCATGNGQAATHLTRHFGQVKATDESGEMIAQAPHDPGITYRVAEAEDGTSVGGKVRYVNPKIVQEMLGHATIAQFMDIY